MTNYSIGEFAKKIGVTVQTLRNWHKKGELIRGVKDEVYNWGNE